METKIDMRIFTEKHRENLSEANRKKWKNPVIRKKITDGIKKSYTKELKEKKKQLALENWKNNTDRREKMSKWNKDRIVSDKTKEKISKSNTKNILTIRRKQLVIERKGRCQHCNNKKEKLHIHHINGHQWDNELENLQLLCPSCHKKIHCKIDKLSNRFAGLTVIENHIAEILKRLGIDLTDPNFKETPLRVARVYNEFFEGLKNNIENEIKEELSKTFPSKIDLMIVEKGITVYSLCPHHLLPVIFEVNIGYVPNGRVVGISKLVRVIELILHRPILQEDATEKIAEIIQKYLRPKGVMILIKGQHYCMIMRGIKTEGKIITSAVRGIFKDNAVTRDEFLKLLMI